jgi:hypothetical protein
LKKLIERYLNGLIWWEDNGKKKTIKYEQFEKAQELMGQLEENLKEKGITTDQLSKLIYYGKYFHDCFKTTKVTENVVNYVMKHLSLPIE